ncbi:LUD domain-containing protein [Methanobrevibacter curvatus]|uniref:Lactate utilization protein B n=1 Tax=Methanobrevibacter curvatus TaxID=49547 RepID=A0A166D630_9EURY|nr:LUD domain-containing protein [Methanobrevibacter curvatus]KZX15244.1 lactate utilization protein B [Methanobrevibacter curvatus]
MESLNLESMKNSFKTVVDKREKILKEPKTLELEKKVQKIRKKSIKYNDKLIEMAKESFTRNGIDFFYADDDDKAIDILDEILSNLDWDKLIAKSKSNTLREIGFNEYFTKKGFDIVDTDLGDRILQLKEVDNLPSHPTGPACHLNRYDIADIVNNSLNTNISAEPSEIMECVKEDVFNRLSNAKIGVSGANSIAAEDGSIILIHNEGNISLVSMMNLHIVVAGIDKLVETIEDGLAISKLETIYATGSLLTSYINIISGPSKTADIEKKLLKNMYGPERVVLILVDNGRKKIMESIPSSLECIGCGSCILTCPVYGSIGNEFGYKNYLGGRGVAMANYIENSKISFDCGLFKCTLCKQCTVSCPLDIPTFDLIEKTRKTAQKENHSPKNQKKILENIKNNGSPYNL